MAGDAFRIRHNSNLFGTNLDGLMIEKTYGNNLTPDGGIANPSYPLQVNGDAGKSTGTSWINTSDIRLKDILALDVVNYRYKQNNPRGLQSEKPVVGFVPKMFKKLSQKQSVRINMAICN